MTIPRRLAAALALLLGLFVTSGGIAHAATVQDYPCGRSVVYGQFIYFDNCLKTNMAVLVQGPGASYVTCVPASSVLVLDRGSAARISYTNKVCF